MGSIKPACEPGTFPEPLSGAPQTYQPQKGSFCWLLLFKKVVNIENAYMRFLMKFFCVNIAHFVIYVL